MNNCLFVSDLHGIKSRYEALFKVIKKEKPDFVFIGGDLLPHKSISQTGNYSDGNSFITEFLFRKFNKLKESMDCSYPDVFLIPGNDDHKIVFDTISDGEKANLWQNIHNQCIVNGKYRFYGYACVPPTPFMIKDWDRFDINGELGPGCVAPADGYHSMPPDYDPERDTIQNDLLKLTHDDVFEFGVFLFHSPPFQTFLDHAVINEGTSDRKPIVINVGSKAIRNLIEERQPYITMHGHIHESAGITGEWKQELGRTWSFSAAHDGPELAVIKFELQNPLSATRRLIMT